MQELGTARPPLWQGLCVGMSQQEARQVMPELVPAKKAERLGDGARGLLEYRGFRLAGKTFIVTAYFADKLLRQVIIGAGSQIEFRDFEAVAQALRAKYGAENSSSVDPDSFSTADWQGETGLIVRLVCAPQFGLLNIIFQNEAAPLGPVLEEQEESEPVEEGFDKSTVVEMVEDYFRGFIAAMQTHGMEAAIELATRFEARIEMLATKMTPLQAAGFTQKVEAERERMMAEYQSDPIRLKRRLGLPLGIDGTKSSRSRGSNLADVAARTAVRATVWETISALFRLGR